MATKLKQKELAPVKRELLSKQNGACIFCGGDLTSVSSYNQVVDHNHDTGIIRGVAHRGCNGVDGKITALLRRWGKCSTKVQVIRMLRRLADFYEKEPKTDYIYPTHKTALEKKELRNKRARERYRKKKEASNV